jgi:hypothetical protein
MKKLLLLIFLFSSVTYGADCEKHPIYCQILKNKSRIAKTYAMQLSDIIHNMHVKYHIPSRIFTAILMQESGYSLKAKGCHTGIRKRTDEEIQYFFDVELKRGMTVKQLNAAIKEEIEVCTDFGISQVYYKTAKRFKFDIEKLTSDLEYSVEAGAKVLAGFMKRYEARDNDWYLRYNCGSRGTTKRDTCQVYKKMVERYL